MTMPDFPEVDYSAIAELEQGTEEWVMARVGKVTASRCADATATSQRGEAAARRDYRAELISEILTGLPYPRFVTREMQWGLAQEPYARAAYELSRDVLVDTAGFVLHPDEERFRGRFGCSPDGYVGENGMVQFKCPTTATHLAWILGGRIPLEHMPQLLAELACNPEREWIEFVSFDPRMPEHLQLFVCRFFRNDNLIAVVENEVEHFNDELDSQIAALPEKPQGVVLSMDLVDDDEMQF